MKWLCILLLLGNIAYFGWELDKRSVAQNSSIEHSLPSIPSQAIELNLLDELADKPSQRVVTDVNENLNAAQETPATSELGLANTDLDLELKVSHLDIIKQLASEQVAGEKTVCMSYGPIETDKKTEELTAYFNEENIYSETRESITENKLFWVYLTAQSTAGVAEDVMKDLKQKGVTDYQLIKSGRFKNAISLGLFSSKERVDYRLNEINAKGYEPVVVPYNKPDLKNIYWVDAMFDTSVEGFERIISGVPTGYDSVPIACSKIALSTENP